MSNASVITGGPPPPPPPSPPPPPYALGCESASSCVYFDVSDREILTSLLIFALMGGLLLMVFGCIRHKAPIFFGRRRLRNLVRPRAKPNRRRSEGRQIRGVWPRRADPVDPTLLTFRSLFRPAASLADAPPAPSPPSRRHLG